MSQERGLSLVETARLFALMNVSIHDALQTTLTCKSVYGLWRPVTAIRQADTDLSRRILRSSSGAASCGVAHVERALPWE